MYSTKAGNFHYIEISVLFIGQLMTNESLISGYTILLSKGFAVVCDAIGGQVVSIFHKKPHLPLSMLGWFLVARAELYPCKGSFLPPQWSPLHIFITNLFLRVKKPSRTVGNPTWRAKVNIAPLTWANKCLLKKLVLLLWFHENIWLHSAECRTGVLCCDPEEILLCSSSFTSFKNLTQQHIFYLNINIFVFKKLVYTIFFMH